MNNVTKSPKVNLPRDPVHQRQILWQIFIPLGVTIFLVVLSAVLMLVFVSDEAGDLAAMSNVSIIILSVQALLIGIPTLVLLVYSIYGLVKLLQVAPLYSMIARSYVYMASVYIIQALNVSVEPFLIIHSYSASAKKLAQQLIPRRK